MNIIFPISILLVYSSSCSFSLIGEAPASIYSMQNQICKTSGCIRAAQFISKNLDTRIDPCDNFYQFACGKYIKESTIRQDMISASVLGEADDRIKQQLKEGIEEKITTNDSRTLQLLQSHYNSCLDIRKIERTSMKILSRILNELGDWPILVGNYWNESKFDWKNLIYQLRRNGYLSSMNSLIKVNIEVDEKNNTKNVITLDQGETGIAHEYLVEGMDNKVVQVYYKYMVDIAKILGVKTQHAKKELLGPLFFEIELAKISSSEEERRNMSLLYNPMTAEELQSKYPDVSWKEYLNELFQPHYVVESTERIIVKNPNYLKAITELISKTPKRVLANYMLWRVIEEIVPYLNNQARRSETEFMTSITGTTVEQPRWIDCIDHVNNYLPVAVGALYVRKIFDKNFKKEGETLVEHLRKTFENLLEKVDWMDKNTKRRALKKLKSMYAHVAYPDELLDDNELDELFKNLKAVPDDYLDSYLSSNLFNLDYTYQQLRKPYNKTGWVKHGDVAIVNAFYEFSENSMLIPAGFFQEEFFAIDKPNYINYGVIGYFIGHELTHAFDDEGSQYDEEGNLANWWDPKVKKEYQSRAQCIVNQYGNYTVKDVDMKLNGINTQGENIADNGGIKIAYHAYKEYEKRNGPEPRLPGLPYSPQQLFWISNANAYCEKYRPEALESHIIVEEHSPGEFRVIGAMSNVPEFAKDFECPLRSFMNPTNKCTVW